jgi:WD40 repeat protein
VNSACFTSDNKSVVSACRDFTIFVWDVCSGSALQKFQTKSLCNSLDSFEKYVASGHEDGAIRVWKLGQQDPFKTISDAHFGSVTSLQYKIDGSNIVTLGEDSLLKTFDNRSDQFLNIISTQQSKGDFNGQCVVLASGEV